RTPTPRRRSPGSPPPLRPWTRSPRAHRRPELGTRPPGTTGGGLTAPRSGRGIRARRPVPPAIAPSGSRCRVTEGVIDVAPSVLVVGNDPLLQQRMQAGLEARGFVIETAETGRAALRQASRHRPDVVVLETWLPDQDGIALAVALRATCGERLPILILGASVRDLARAQPAGACTYLHTPLQLDELVATVDQVLRK